MLTPVHTHFWQQCGRAGRDYFHPVLDLYLKVCVASPKVPRFRWIKPAWEAWLDSLGSFAAAVSLLVNL